MEMQTDHMPLDFMDRLVSANKRKEYNKANCRKWKINWNEMELLTKNYPENRSSYQILI